MDTTKADDSQSIPRTALRNVSNNQQTGTGSGTSRADLHKTPTSDWSQSERAKTAPGRKAQIQHHRRLSYSHGDLSRLRPKSPPLYSLIAEVHGTQSPPRDGVGEMYDTPYSNHALPNRPLLPCDWLLSDPSHGYYTQPGKANRTPPYEVPAHLNAMHAGKTNDHGPSDAAFVVIQGLNPSVSRPEEFLEPFVQAYPLDFHANVAKIQGQATQVPTVQHLDTTNIWKGMRFPEAEELYRVHRACRITLEKILANELWRLYHAFNSDHLRRAYGEFHGVSFCRAQLLEEMAEYLYYAEDDMAKAPYHLLHMYLAATDQLVQHHGDEMRDISITVRPSYTLSIPCPSVEAISVPDFITFKELEIPYEGLPFSLIPQYQSRSAFTAAPFAANFQYTSGSAFDSLSWLVWDTSIAGFHGVVPRYSQMRNSRFFDKGSVKSYTDNFHDGSLAKTSIPIEVKAILTIDNGYQIRYTRILRVCLVLDVLPWGLVHHKGVAMAFQHHRVDSPRPPLHIPTTDNSPSGICISPGRVTRQGTLSTSAALPDLEAQILDISCQIQTGSSCNTEILSDIAKKHAELALQYARLAHCHADGEVRSDYRGSWTKSSTRAAQHEATSESDGCQKAPQSSQADYLIPSQSFDEVSQTWTRALAPTERLDQRRNLPNLLPQPENCSEDTPGNYTMLSSLKAPTKEMKEKAGPSLLNELISSQCQYVGKAHATSSPELKDQKSPPSIARSLKRLARSNSNDSSPTKRLKGEGESSGSPSPIAGTTSQTGSSSHDGRFDTNSPVCSQNLPIVALESREQRVPRQSSQCTDPSYRSESHSDVGGVSLSKASADHSTAHEAQPILARPTNKGSLEVSPLMTPPESLRHSSLDTASSGISKNGDNVSMKETGGEVNRIVSTNLDIISEDPQVKVCRHEQAREWSYLQGLDDAYRMVQDQDHCSETGLSKEELEAYLEAVERSIDDMVGDFSSMFLETSDEGSTAIEDCEDEASVGEVSESPGLEDDIHEDNSFHF